MTPAPTIVGIDLGKKVSCDRFGCTRRDRVAKEIESLTARGVCRHGAAMHRRDRGVSRLAVLGRVFARAGHEIRILPAQFVKPYLKANKNDFNDAAAI